MIKHSLEFIKEFAKKKGGKCLSNQYININTPLLWQCEFGHTWQSSFRDILHKGYWCKICSGKQKHSINDMRDLAMSRNGKCLSEQYINNKTKLEWKCENGHTWFATPNNVLRGSWCPFCNRYISEDKCRYIFEKLLDKKFIRTRKPLENKYELDGYNDALKLAFEYQGIQHSQFVKFFHRNDLSLFIKRQQYDIEKKALCLSKGIILISIPYEVNQNNKTLIEFIKNSLSGNGIRYKDKSVNMLDFYQNTSKLKEMQELANSKDGLCLSNIYINSRTKYKWQCHRGHKWYASYNEIKNHKRWCPQCAHNYKHNLYDMIKTAHKNGGTCLSEKYINCDTKYQWKCHNGHQWEATYSSILAGSWCPHCSNVAKKSIHYMNILANSKGGKCLSTEYINMHTKLEWQCAKGHRWFAKPNDIQSGHWCKQCYNERRIQNLHLKE